MMSREQNEQLSRIGPGTLMGKLLRRYWEPFLLAEEIPEPDCPPVRVKLIGENLVAFRDSKGRIGLVDEFCAHRGAHDERSLPNSSRQQRRVEHAEPHRTGHVDGRSSVFLYGRAGRPGAAEIWRIGASDDRQPRF
jgi:hypothetical protein